jgi:creatinine amidohydrolase
MKEVSEELDPKWAVGPTRVHYVAEYYDRTAVNDYVKTTLGITQKRGGGFGDNYYNTAILMAVNPESARLKERTEADQLRVAGVSIEPIEKTIEHGKTILQMQTDQTVKAIQETISRKSRK